MKSRSWIDCGTNFDPAVDRRRRMDGRLRDVHREMRIVRLGEGVDATGQFAPVALARTARGARRSTPHRAARARWPRGADGRDVRRARREQPRGVLRDHRRTARRRWFPARWPR